MNRLNRLSCCCLPGRPSIPCAPCVDVPYNGVCSPRNQVYYVTFGGPGLLGSGDAGTICQRLAPSFPGNVPAPDGLGQYGYLLGHAGGDRWQRFHAYGGVSAAMTLGASVAGNRRRVDSFTVEGPAGTWSYECRNGQGFVSDRCAGVLTTCFPYAVAWMQLPRVWAWPAVCADTTINVTVAGWTGAGGDCACHAGGYLLVNFAGEAPKDGNCVGGDWRAAANKDCAPWSPWFVEKPRVQLFAGTVVGVTTYGTSRFTATGQTGLQIVGTPECGQLPGVRGGAAAWTPSGAGGADCTPGTVVVTL